MVLKLSLFILTAILAASTVNALTVCNSTQPCSTGWVCYKPAECRSGYCNCDYNNGYEDDGTGGCVKPTKLVGDACTNKGQCWGVSTDCQSGTCQCSNNYVVNADKKDCSPVTVAPQPLNAYCNSTVFCSATAPCNYTSNQCQCGYLYKRISGNNVDCAPLVLNDICQPSDCGPDASYCINRQATCDSGRFACISGYTWMTAAGDNAPTDGCYKNSTKLKDLNARCSPANGDICKSNYRCDSCPETPTTATCLSFPVQYNASKRTISSVTVMIFTTISAILLRSF